MLENKKFMKYFISELIKARIERQLNQRGKNGMGRLGKGSSSAGGRRCHSKKNVKIQKAQKSNRTRKERSNKVSKRDTVLRKMARILVPMQWNRRKLRKGVRSKNRNVKKLK